MNLQRIPEPNRFSPAQEASEYQAMDHSEVNSRFVDDLLTAAVGPRVIGPRVIGPRVIGPCVIDLGCGPAGIPIELCQRAADIRVIAVDGEVEMLEIAKREIDSAGLLDRITLQHADACQLTTFEDGMADTVISNSLIHHLDLPEQGLATAVRLTRRGGRLFVRDLFRPESAAEVERLVQLHAGEESENAKQLFRQSLHAALTLEEIRELARGLGIREQDVQMTSDRHWTIDWSSED